MAPLKLRLNAPLLLPLAGLSSGILMAELGAGLISGAALIAFGIFLYELLARMSSDPVTTYHVRNLHYLWVAAIFAGTGTIVASVNRPADIPSGMVRESVMAYAHLCDIKNTTSGDRVLVKVTALMDSSGRARAVAPMVMIGSADDMPANVDDDMIFPCTIQPITDNPNSFDSGYAERMRRKGILYNASIIGDSVRIIGHTRTLNGISHGIREDIERFIENTSLGEPTKYFLITILTGDKAYLDEDRRALFTASGVSHILALSGLHVSIISGIILWLLFPFNLMGLYRWRYALAVPAVWAYAFVTGLNPSTVRSAIMMTVMITCLVLERKNSAWNSLLLAVFVIILFNPASIHDIGLQLSFVCVATMVFFAEAINPVDRRRHPRLYSLAAALAAILCATGGSWVLTSYYFGIFPLSFIPANIIVLPLLPVYMVAALLFFACHAAGLQAWPLAEALDMGYESLEWLLAQIKGDGSSVLSLQVPGITVGLWLLSLSAMAIWFYHKRTRLVLGISSLLAAAALALIPFGADAERGFIMQSRVDRPQILLKNGREIKTLNFEPAAVSETKLFDSHVTVADCPVSLGDFRQCDYLIVTRSCTDALDSLLHKFNPTTIVIHPSVRRDREMLMLHQADSLGIRMHSIRNDGPLKVFKHPS